MEDWRIEVDMPEDEHRAGFIEHLMTGNGEAESFTEEFPRAFHERLIVSRDGSTVFIYPHDEKQAGRVQTAINELLASRGWKADVSVTRWHDAEEAWEAADVPLPHTAAEERAEHEALIARERRQTEQEHYFAFDVVVTLPHHGQAKKLAEQLNAAGLTVARRWRYVVIGATDEDAASELEKRIQPELPEGSTLTVFTAENLRETVNYVASLGADNPFAIPGLPGLAH